MSLEATERTMQGYTVSRADYIAPDAVYVNMATGEETRGREAVDRMLGYTLREAFQAQVEPTNIIISDGKACVEATVIGKHIGEFAGVPATGKEVRYPLCVVYDIDAKKELIRRVRVYLPLNLILDQIGAS